MTEEKNGVNNGTPNSEMAPQEDGTKVPLTDQAGVKFSSNSPSNGDAKIDISSGQVFSGLTKEELMKYADDPFWVRLRWVLFIIFWGGWLAMLVMAIVIIIQAPRCAPKETLEWVQESAMLQYEINHPNPVDVNENGAEDPEDLVKMAESLGIKTVYLEDLISTVNFENLNNIYDTDKITAILEAAKEANLHVVTDFVSSPVPEANTWFQNKNMSDFFIPDSRNLDFSNPDLLQKIVELFSTVWMERGVLGFLVDNADETLANATVTITKGLEEVNGAVAYGVTDVNHELNNFSPETFKAFLDNHVDVWSYFKFNPMLAESDTSSKGVADLVTMTLFLVPGTPILKGIEQDYFMTKKAFIKMLSEFREKESVQIGSMSFANTTTEDIVAFARMPVKKGTPGCAVAVNFHETNSTEVDFRSISGVPEKGDLHIKLSNAKFSSGELGRTHLSKVVLQPLEGVVVLFVPDL